MAFCAIHIDRIVHLHLQDQVRSTLQIEAQVDVLGHRRKQSLTGKTLRNPKDSEQKKQQCADDEIDF